MEEVLNWLISEAAGYVVEHGMDQDAAFLEACRQHELMLQAGRGYGHSARMESLINAAGVICYERMQSA